MGKDKADGREQYQRRKELVLEAIRLVGPMTAAELAVAVDATWDQTMTAICALPEVVRIDGAGTATSPRRYGFKEHRGQPVGPAKEVEPEPAEEVETEPAKEETRSTDAAGS